jgi:carboxyl-terminal processing protease
MVVTRVSRLKRLLCLLLVAIVLVACSGATATPTTAPATATPSQASAQTTAPAAPASAPAATSAATPPSAPAPSRTPATPAAAGIPASPVATPIFPNTTPDAGAALVEQAVGYLLDYYVDELPSAPLYQAAFNGAVTALGTFGKAVQPPPLSLTGDRKAQAAAFKAAYLTLAKSGGTDVNQTALAYEAIRAMTAQIDECHTAFLDPEQLRSVTAGLAGTNTYGGIGVSIRTQTRPVTIGGIFPNTPASRSGLRTGDAIIAVDGVDVSDLPGDAISPLVRGKEGTNVRLTVRRQGEAAPLQFTITRALIQVPVFYSDVLKGPGGEKIGYLKLYSFSTDADQQVREALETFEREGVKYWVLDLRDNGGGYIDVLSRIASLFVRDGEPVAYRLVRGGTAETIDTDPALALDTRHPLAILINGGSASASEALASSAYDHGYARLFGQTTSGCLAGATNYKLADNSALQITIWKIVSPQRREINRLGQAPNEEVAPDPTGATDPILDAAIKWLVTQPQPR